MKTAQQQEKDIQRFAEWGFDFYKFNWGSYMAVNRDKGLPGLQEIYQLIRTALINTHRDMVFSVCAPANSSEQWATT